jgi:hypothetical protein
LNQSDDVSLRLSSIDVLSKLEPQLGSRRDRLIDLLLIHSQSHYSWVRRYSLKALGNLAAQSGQRRSDVIRRLFELLEIDDDRFVRLSAQEL